jgi:hypothetical protein
MLFTTTHIVGMKVELNQLTERAQLLMASPVSQDGYDLPRFPLSLNHLTTRSMMGRLSPGSGCAFILWLVS